MDPRLIAALDARDTASAVAFMQDEDDPGRVLAMFHGAIRHAYWSNKDIATVVALGSAAVEYAGDDDHRLRFLKPIAYDVGSFCWPGWEEAGIDIDDAVLAEGRKAAALNLSLAYRLERPNAGKSNAHWLIGAYLLTDGHADRAAVAFEQALALAEDDESRELMRSYVSKARNA